jgi:Protein of unknown function (DUF3467)
MAETVDVVISTEAGLSKRSVLVTRTPTADHQSVYANNCRIMCNFFDARISFGDVIEANDEQLSVSDKVTVILSLENLKSLHQMIAQQLQQYEIRFGVIRAEPTMK